MLPQGRQCQQNLTPAVAGGCRLGRLFLSVVFLLCPSFLRVIE